MIIDVNLQHLYINLLKRSYKFCYHLEIYYTLLDTEKNTQTKWVLDTKDQEIMLI